MTKHALFWHLLVSLMIVERPTIHLVQIWKEKYKSSTIKQIQILTLNLQRKDRKQILVESHLWSVVMTTHMPRMLSSLTFIQEGSRFQSVHKKYFHLVININAMNLEKCPWITLQVHLKIIFMWNCLLVTLQLKKMLTTGCSNLQLLQT